MEINLEDVKLVDSFVNLRKIAYLDSNNIKMNADNMPIDISLKITNEAINFLKNEIIVYTVSKLNGIDANCFYLNMLSDEFNIGIEAIIEKLVAELYNIYFI